MSVAEKTAEKAKEALRGGNGNGNGKESSKLPSNFTGLKTRDVSGLLSKYSTMISQVIPKHLTPERVIQIATTVIVRNPEIAACTTDSLVGAVIQASILGFDPTPQIGQCYFVPYNKNKDVKEVQFQIGYRGLIDLVRRSGEVSDIYAYPVYENDEFEFQYGTEPKVIHKPRLEGRGALKAVYAVVHFKNGGYMLEVMGKEDVYKIKSHSKAAGSQYSPWNIKDFEPEMWRKTVLKRLLKYAPISVEKAKQYSIDGAVIRPESFDQETKEADPQMVEYEDVSDKPIAEEKTVSEPVDDKKPEPAAQSEFSL